MGAPTGDAVTIAAKVKPLLEIRVLALVIPASAVRPVAFTVGTSEERTPHTIVFDVGSEGRGPGARGLTHALSRLAAARSG